MGCTLARSMEYEVLSTRRDLVLFSGNTSEVHYHPNVPV